MTDVLGVGTVALDSVSTPSGSVTDVAGGSALYFAAAARHFAPVALVGIAGEDFPPSSLDALAELGVDVSGIARSPGESFRWKVRYDEALLHRETLETNRGVTLGTVPSVPTSMRSPGVVFLGSTDPTVQASVLDQLEAPGMVVLDTMSHWIEDRREDLASVLARADILLVNEEEAALLAGSRAPSLAAAAIRRMGPTWVVVKRGTGGAGAFGAAGEVLVPARRVDSPVDPTGAGDAFAGGFVGMLAGSTGLGAAAVQRALEAGAYAGALAVTSFSMDALLTISTEDVRGALRR